MPADRLSDAMTGRDRLRRRYRSRQARARLGGYFWMPCPRCNEHFSGHEVVGRITLPDPTEPGLSQMVCPPCETELGQQLAAECEREGHRRIEQWAGETTARGSGSMSVLFRLDRPPAGVFCGRCGIDLEQIP